MMSPETYLDLMMALPRRWETWRKMIRSDQVKQGTVEGSRVPNSKSMLPSNSYPRRICDVSGAHGMEMITCWRGKHAEQGDRVA